MARHDNMKISSWTHAAKYHFSKYVVNVMAMGAIVFMLNGLLAKNVTKMTLMGMVDGNFTRYGIHAWLYFLSSGTENVLNPLVSNFPLVST